MTYDSSLDDGHRPDLRAIAEALGIEPDYGSGPSVLDSVARHYERFILPLDHRDVWTIALWTGHTWLVAQMYTTPRIMLTSPMPESGKTTVLEHMQRLCYSPITMSSAGSPALLVRLLADSPRTLLIDEADRNLRPDKPEVADVLAIINTGYKKGAVRPHLEPVKGGGWEPKEMSTFAPVAMAGIAPDLPDDTLSRTIVVTMVPDLTGDVEESDWEHIEAAAEQLGHELGEWASQFDVLPDVDRHLPAGCKGRMKEKWRPMMRVAVLAGGDWPKRCRELVDRDIERRDHEREEGLMSVTPQLALLQDIVAVWPHMSFWPTESMRAAMHGHFPDRWGPDETRFKRGLTVQRIGRYLGRTLQIRSTRVGEVRGYRYEAVHDVAARLGIRKEGAG